MSLKAIFSQDFDRRSDFNRRSMRGSKLFIGNLSYNAQDEDLLQMFPSCINAEIIVERGTGRSRGFAFVTFRSRKEASSAMSQFENVELQGRRINISWARESGDGRFRNSSSAASAADDGKGSYTTSYSMQRYANRVDEVPSGSGTRKRVSESRNQTGGSSSGKPAEGNAVDAGRDANEVDEDDNEPYMAAQLCSSRASKKIKKIPAGADVLKLAQGGCLSPDLIRTAIREACGLAYKEDGSSSELIAPRKSSPDVTPATLKLAMALIECLNAEELNAVEEPDWFCCEQDYDNTTLLRNIVRSGQVEICRKLLSCGGDANTLFPAKTTLSPLEGPGTDSVFRAACQGANLEMAKLLAEHSTLETINLVNWRGSTAIEEWGSAVKRRGGGRGQVETPDGANKDDGDGQEEAEKEALRAYVEACFGEVK